MIDKTDISHSSIEPESAKALGLAMLDAVIFESKGTQIKWLSPEDTAHLFASNTDYLPTHITGLSRLLTQDGQNARRDALRALTWDGASYKVEYEITRFDGQRIWLEERGRRVTGDSQGAHHIIAVLRDIQSQKTAEHSAAYAASFDPLTRLWNADRMQSGIRQMIATSQRYDRSCALVGLKISNLTSINKTYGYDAGDRLLVNIATRLKSHLRAPDMLGRTEGDVLVMGVFDCAPEAAAIFAARLREALSDTPYSTPFGALYAECAMGAVDIPKQCETAIDALNALTCALHHSQKRQDVFMPYSADLAPLATRRKQRDMTESDILDAINSRRITLAYQPVVHAQSRKPHHYECLLRLRREDGQVVPAGEFIMAAERLGLVHLLDRRALEIASETLRSVPNVKLALNISVATAKDDIAAHEYIAALKSLGPKTQRLIVELTETLAIEDPIKASQFSNAVRALGCTFAIDDFGAGYTTFQNLMAIEADEIKIDGSFIRDLSVTPHKQVFVRMMVDLAQTFSVKTVAEFVNTREDADLLTRLGVDYLQGYMFGVPTTSPDWPMGGKDDDSDQTLSAAAS